MPPDHKSEAVQWHAVPLETVISNLQIDTASGLTMAEASNRIVTYGKNELPRGRTITWWQMLLRQFKSPLVYVLLVAAILTLWLRELTDTAVILFSVIINTLIGFYQEYRANDLLNKLKSIVRVEALVVRGGTPRVVDSLELVPGDIIIIKAGSKVPADARLIELHQLETNEAVLTGESSGVRKITDICVAETSVGDRLNMVWMGTAVERGDGRAVVVATGANTEIGRIARLTQQTATVETTPLQERFGRLADIISAIVGVSAVLIFIIGLIRDISPVEIFTTAVAVAVSAIPEGLVAALSVVLAVSTARILKSKGLVRRSIAAETLGSVTVICTDKTGTLTEGTMKVEKFVPDGSAAEALLCLALANEAVIEEKNSEKIVRGEATDRAKLEYALAQGLDLGKINNSMRQNAFLPFDSGEKYLAAFYSLRESVGPTQCLVSGAPEILLRKSTRRGGGDAMTEDARREISHEIGELANDGYRVIGLAERLVKETINFSDDGQLHSMVNELTFRGYVAVRDPIRADVPRTLNLTRSAGVRVIMVTGDHRLTAMAIGRDLGFRTGENNVLDGQQLDKLSDDELASVVDRIDICVRVNPEHKLRIVNALLKNGESVSMTGDGINDAPALKAADIGVAVGTATDVTKEAADLVLLDDGFSTIVNAIKEGRIAMDNIKKVTILLLSGSFTAFLLVMASLILGVPLPLSAVQILWANLVENGLPNFALAFEPGESDIMDRKPLPRKAPLLDNMGKTIIFGISILRDFILVCLFLWYYLIVGEALPKIQTIIFAALSLDSLLYIFAVKSFNKPIWKVQFIDNPYLLFSVGVGVVMVIAAVYLPLLNTFLRTVPLPIQDVMLVLSIPLIDVVLIETVKFFYRQRIGRPVEATV